MNMDMPLHTPQELVQLSNAAHVAEGVVLAIIGVLVIAQGLGYLQKAWQRYLVPSIALFASLILAGFLFVDHYNELPAAWHWVTTDMQQQQHLLIGIILGVTSIAALVGLKLKQKWLELALPVAFAAIGVVFLVHPQHGSDSEAARALFIHRVAGTSLILAGLAGAGALLYKQWRKLLAIVAGVLLIVSAGLFVSYREPLMTADDMNMGGVIQSHRTYSLNLMEGMAYQPNQSSELMFDIRDENNNVLKSFDTVHEKQMHLIVVRKDRAYFQHVHPNFDKNSGMFAITGFKFPTDGEYRVFADFTASSSQMGPDGMKLTATPYKDVKVGNGKYTPQPASNDKLSSSANGFDTNFFFAPDDDTPSGLPNTDFFAGQSNTVAIAIDKDGQPYTSLQPYLGALGHMVVLGPNLEFVHAHPQNTDLNSQSGLIIFDVNFPDPGQYKLYLQTQAENQVTTTDYTLTVKPNPSSSKNTDQNSQPAEDMNMEHMGH